MNDAPAVTAVKPKKSVALSGVVAGNTALCTVGRTGNDLHYRGYDILDIAARCEFEEMMLHAALRCTCQFDGASSVARCRGLTGLLGSLIPGEGCFVVGKDFGKHDVRVLPECG